MLWCVPLLLGLIAAAAIVTPMPRRVPDSSSGQPAPGPPRTRSATPPRPTHEDRHSAAGPPRDAGTDSPASPEARDRDREAEGRARQAVWRYAHLPPVLFTNRTLYAEGDAGSRWTEARLSVVIAITAADMRLLRALLQSLHLATDLRTCTKLLVHPWQAPGCTECPRVQREITRRQQQGDPEFWGAELLSAPTADAHALTALGVARTTTHFALLLQPQALFVAPFHPRLCLQHMMAQGLAHLRLPAATAEVVHAPPAPALLRLPLNSTAVVQAVAPRASAATGAHVSFPFAGVGVWRVYARPEDAAYRDSVTLSRYRYPKRPRHRRGGYERLVAPHICPDRGCVWRCEHAPPSPLHDRDAPGLGDGVSSYMAARLTVVITAAPVPSNPSAALLLWVLQSLQQMPDLQECQTIVVLDAPKAGLPADRQDAYRGFETRVRQCQQRDPLCRRLQVLPLPEHGHLTGSLRAATRAVATPYVLVLQQDLPFARPVDVFHSLRTLEANGGVKHLRFNTHPNTPAAFDVRLDLDVPGPAFVPLIRTEGWSDQNHMASVRYYREFVLPSIDAIPEPRRQRMCKGGAFMECFMNQLWNAEYARVRNWSRVHAVFGTYIYGVPGEAPYCLHVDGSEKHGGLPRALLQCVDVGAAGALRG